MDTHTPCVVDYAGEAGATMAHFLLRSVAATYEKGPVERDGQRDRRGVEASSSQPSAISRMVGRTASPV